MPHAGIGLISFQDGVLIPIGSRKGDGVSSNPRLMNLTIDLHFCPIVAFHIIFAPSKYLCRAPESQSLPAKTSNFSLAHTKPVVDRSKSTNDALTLKFKDQSIFSIEIYRTMLASLEPLYLVLSFS